MDNVADFSCPAQPAMMFYSPVATLRVQNYSATSASLSNKTNLNARTNLNDSNISSEPQEGIIYYLKTNRTFQELISRFTQMFHCNFGF
jgi:hypothetical protein